VSRELANLGFLCEASMQDFVMARKTSGCRRFAVSGSSGIVSGESPCNKPSNFSRAASLLNSLRAAAEAQQGRAEISCSNSVPSERIFSPQQDRHRLKCEAAISFKTLPDRTWTDG
jgi:hypothetical protein